MFALKTAKYRNLDCVRLENVSLSLLVAQSIGPRILELRFQGGENLMADVPDAILECPGAGRLRLWGGHRLWHAPEVARRTYMPDDQPVAITEIPHGIEVVQPVEAGTGIQKAMRIALSEDSATVVIDHTLTNCGLWDIECAPWAITQLRLGGVAILPHPTQPTDAEGLLSNRIIVLWPYTDITSEHIVWGNRFTFMKAQVDEGALKVGFPNPRGWIAYSVGDTLFVKNAAFDPCASYFDHDASTQCYCNPHFIELETLGPRAIIPAGQSVAHQEIWRVYAETLDEPTEAAAQALVERLGLELQGEENE
jgi:hypothetical protein